MAEDKFKEEFERLLRQHGRIIALLYLVDANISIRREIEDDNGYQPTHMKRSIEVERSREQLQRHLDEVKQAIDDVVTLMTKHAKGEQPGSNDQAA